MRGNFIRCWSLKEYFSSEGFLFRSQIQIPPTELKQLIINQRHIKITRYQVDSTLQGAFRLRFPGLMMMIRLNSKLLLLSAENLKVLCPDHLLQRTAIHSVTLLKEINPGSGVVAAEMLIHKTASREKLLSGTVG